MAGVATTITRGRTSSHQVNLPPLAVEIGIILAIALALGLAWRFTAHTVTVSVDGITDSVRSHRGTVGEVIQDLEIALSPYDRVLPDLATPLRDTSQITIERARPLRILSDGRDFVSHSWATDVRTALADSGIAFDAYDRALINGVEVDLDAPLPAAQVVTRPVTYDWGYAWEGQSVEPLQIRVRRAIPMTVDDGSGAPYVIRTTAPTVGEAMRQAQITLYLGDKVEPSLGSAVTTGLKVAIERSVPVSVEADGERRKTRTQARTVGDALANLGVYAGGMDIVSPPLDTPLYDDIEIRVTRIREDIEVEEQIEPYETLYQGDPNLAIDTQQVINAGAEGITRQRYRVRYENGEAVSRVLEDEWIAQSPDTRIVAYGQSITPQTATVEGQQITYWRRIRMLATSYTAESAGGNITRTGDVLRDGIVAVDPSIVPLRSQVYVPGYGMGDALDTGGGVIAKHIDLAYVDRPYVWTRRWVDVYLLWPPPAAGNITWVLPNYPRE
jgi:uncharacterized protein YabE (DUF348 family)